MVSAVQRTLQFQGQCLSLAFLLYLIAHVTLSTSYPLILYIIFFSEPRGSLVGFPLYFNQAIPSLKKTPQKNLSSHSC